MFGFNALALTTIPQKVSYILLHGMSRTAWGDLRWHDGDFSY